MNKINEFLKRNKNLTNDELIIKAYEFVQGIPYRVCKFENVDELVLNNYGDCRHKHEFLYKVFSSLGLRVEKIKVLFDWKDLSIPNSLLETLKESGTVFSHDALYLYRGEEKILVDATWNPSLLEYGFPVTQYWDGKSNTEFITRGNIQVFSLEEYFEKKKDLHFKKDELLKFGSELNKFLDTLN